MAKLVKSVFVKDSDRNRTVLLEAGTEPESRLAALVPNPDAWEDGKPPTAAKKTAAKSDDTDGDKQAASRKAATGPARGGRKSAADEGGGS